MNYKKIQKKVASQDQVIKPEMQCLNVRGGYIYATDAFKAIKVPTPHPLPNGVITKESAIVASVTKEDPQITDENDDLNRLSDTLDGLMDNVEHNRDHVITFNRKNMIDLLDSMEKVKGGKDKVTMYINVNDPTKPVQLSNKNATGLLMTTNS